MTKKSDTFKHLWQQLRQSTSVDNTKDNLKQLDDLVETQKLSIPDAYELRSVAFRALQELTADDPNTAESLILELLLPYCFKQPPDGPSDIRRAISRYRDCLVDWLSQYPEAERIVLRDKVLDELRQGLKLADPKGACWTVMRIGFRRDDIVKNLWQVVKNDADEIGNIALFTLTTLGIPSDEHTRLLRELQKRIKVQCEEILVRALRPLSESESLEVVRSHCLKLSVEGRTRSTALRVLTDIADDSEEDTELQDRIWQQISDLFKAHSDAFSFDLYLGNDVAPQCDSAKVVPTILKWMTKQAQTAERSAHLRYLLSCRLEQCVRPRQLKGWAVADEPNAVALLRQDACQDTQAKGHFKSEPMRLKENAWNTLLRLGYEEVLTWFEEGVANETNPFTRKTVSEFLACFRLDPLPPTVLEWVKEPYDVRPNDPSGELASRTAAIQIARSAASCEAFEALCNFGLTYDGKVLQQSIDALAEVAIARATTSEDPIADALVEIAVNGAEPRHRTGAIGALETMAARKLLPDQYASQLAKLLFDKERDSFERSVIVAILGHLSSEELAPHIMKRLQSWARARDDWLGGRSLEALARHGDLLSQPNLLVERLGLQQTGNRWDLSPQSQRTEWAPFIIGLLYLKDPDTFTPAISSLLQTQSWHSAVQVISLLNDFHGGSDRPPLPAVIKKALIERTRHYQTRTSAELEIFEVLAHLMPNTLAQEPWERTWNDWLPAARAALADALGEATYTEPKANTSALSHLLSLTWDGLYAVRRAAYRGLSCRSYLELEAICEDWSQAPTAELRQRAAEACAWLNRDQANLFNELYERLVADQERIVREVARRARRERRERLWAEDYLSYIRETRGKTNEEILSVWRYGQALIQVGNDTCLRTIRADIKTRPLSPHMKHWLRQILKDLDEHWRKVTEKWPDPWWPLEGAIEEGQGTIELIEGKDFPVRYTLWKQPAPTPSQKHEWGGAAWPIDMTALKIIRDEFTLRLKDGSHGTVTTKCFSSQDQVVHFLGVGPYPA
jgi:hypothetical protein